MASGRPGIYFKVLKEGEVKTGDQIENIKRDENNVTVKDIVRLVTGEGNIATLRRAVHIESLAEGWRQEFLEQLAQQDEIG